MSENQEMKILRIVESAAEVGYWFVQHFSQPLERASDSGFGWIGPAPGGNDEVLYAAGRHLLDPIDIPQVVGYIFPEDAEL